MCGICGIWGGSGERRVNEMVREMDHRGPDDRGTFSDAQISLGMTRLAILDTSSGGHQPMSTPDGLIHIVYNGETYNFWSEREILESKGYEFTSTSDTEVVLRMYEEYGDDLVRRLRGMFAFAIYDRRKGPGHERLLLARDHFGIKPLLYSLSEGKFVFASEIKAILASGLIQPEIDPVGLRYLLTYGSVYQPHTILKGVKMLPPAHRMIVDASGSRIERFWSLGVDRFPELRVIPYEAAVDEMGAILEESVRLQMISDVPLGAFLSGGIDSSLMVAMMAKASSEKVKTYSVGFGSEGADMDESDEAAITARHIGTDHTRVTVTASDVRRNIEHIALSLDQPSVDGVNTYYVSRAARSGVTVAVSGNGGDELFAGYPWFIFMKNDQARRSRSAVRAGARSLASSLAGGSIFDPLMSAPLGKIVNRARGLSGFVTRYGNLWQVCGSIGAARLLNKDLRTEALAGRSVNRDLRDIDEIPDGTPVQRVTGLSLRGYNGNQLLRDMDAVSMIHSLELRVPFLDPVVADAALSLPDEAKLGDTSRLKSEHLQTYRDTGAKRILLDIGKKFLPPDFDRKPKRGFAMPFDSWMRGSLREVVEDTLSDAAIRNRGLLDVEAAAQIRESAFHSEGSWMQPWVLMMLELWCRQVVDNSRKHYDPAPVEIAV